MIREGDRLGATNTETNSMKIIRRDSVKEITMEGPMLGLIMM
jgi:hypothetical protein